MCHVAPRGGAAIRPAKTVGPHHPASSSSRSSVASTRSRGGRRPRGRAPAPSRPRPRPLRRGGARPTWRGSPAPVPPKASGRSSSVELRPLRAFCFDARARGARMRLSRRRHASLSKEGARRVLKTAAASIVPPRGAKSNAADDSRRRTSARASAQTSPRNDVRVASRARAGASSTARAEAWGLGGKSASGSISLVRLHRCGLRASSRRARRARARTPLVPLARAEPERVPDKVAGSLFICPFLAELGQG